MTGKEFIDSGIGTSEVSAAQRQQRMINHLTISDIAEDISIDYIKAWAQKKFITNDYFLNYVKTLFKEDNFISFYKYLRYPLATAMLVREEIYTELERVFHADDAYCEYYYRGEKLKKTDALDHNELSKRLFNALMFNHNAVVVTKLNAKGELENEFVSINQITQIEAEHNKVKRIVYNGFMPDLDGKDVEGFIYIDSDKFEFYKKTDKTLSEEPLYVWMHGQESTPVDFVSPEPFYPNKDFAIRYSIFSYLRSDLEEYMFLRTIQRMTEPNGAIPIVTKLKTNETKKSGQKLENENTSDGLPLSSHLVGGQQPTFQKEVVSGGGALQAGTVYEIPAMKLDTGALDMDAVQNFIKFFHHPPEALEYMNKRIDELKTNIIRTVTGDDERATKAAINEKQVSMETSSKQDKLRRISEMLSITSSKIQTQSLKFLFSKEAKAIVYYGSDFFIESKEQIYQMIKEAPNPIERKSLLKRLAGVNNKGNEQGMTRDKILYSLLPYATDADFDRAIARGVSDEDFELQNRFNYWISIFEANYGSIVTFWDGMENEKDSDKLVVINNLLYGFKTQIQMSKIVSLELRKGRAAYDEKGNLISQADKFKIEHDSQQWRNLMKNLGVFGYTSAIVHSVVDATRKEYFSAIKMHDKLSRISSTPMKELDAWSDKIQELKDQNLPEIDKSQIDKEVQSYFAAPVVKTDSTEKDSIIADLQARLAALENKQETPQQETPKVDEPKQETPEKTDDAEDDELKALRARFTELKCSVCHLLGVEKLKEAIAEMEANQTK